MDIQKQQGGDGSQNLQVNGNITCGITYSEARQIALDVFNANCQKFILEAERISENRAKLIVDDFIKKLFEEHPELSYRLQEPSIQYSTFSVIKNYVKTGDENLKERLLELLIHRMGAEDRGLEQIVMDEAIEVLPKLTQDQVNILSLILSAVYLQHNITNLDVLQDYINNKLMVFYPSHKSDFIYNHLQYTGCCTLLSEGGTYKPFLEILKIRFCGLFNKGFSQELLKETFSTDYDRITPIITQCQQNPALLQFNALNDDVLNGEIKRHNLGEFADKIMQLKKQYEMADDEMSDFLNSINPRTIGFLEEWKGKRSGLKSISLTPVGYVIAVLNYNLKTKEHLSFKGVL